MKKILLFIALLTISSCNFFGPVDKTTMKPVKELDDNAITGIWIADNFTYKLAHEKGSYKKDSLQLIFKKNNTFKMINVPDFISFEDNYQKSIESELIDLEGKWKLDTINGSESLNMEFYKSKIFEKGLNTNFNIYQKDGKLKIIYFVGDPDADERFLFLKK